MMDRTALLQSARNLLLNVTPLAADCGRLCAHACCTGSLHENSGMLLFPGEEALYAQAPWARIVPLGYALGDSPALLLTCNGSCPRAERPLACRLFPLFCKVDGEGFAVQLDTRAYALCPLYRYGLKGLSQAFVQTGESCYAMLWQEDSLRSYLRALSFSCSL